jgi:2-iminobutanoate/2-iminopropanoate deaminase
MTGPQWPDWPVEPFVTGAGHQHRIAIAQGVSWGPLLFLSAVRGTRPGGGLDPDVTAQARQCFANLTGLLAEVGSGPERVLRVGMFFLDLQRDRPAVNEVWRETFGEPGPARFAVQVGALGAPGDGSLLLLDVIATRSGG